VECMRVTLGYPTLYGSSDGDCTQSRLRFTARNQGGGTSVVALKFIDRYDIIYRSYKPIGATGNGRIIL
jgi:hypothetical protein